jgi:hypothetical protein
MKVERGERERKKEREREKEKERERKRKRKRERERGREREREREKNSVYGRFGEADFSSFFILFQRIQLRQELSVSFEATLKRRTTAPFQKRNKS